MRAEKGLAMVSDGGPDLGDKPALAIWFEAELRLVEEHKWRPLHECCCQSEERELSSSCASECQRDCLLNLVAFEQAD
jgi:hypothetical protein